MIRFVLLSLFATGALAFSPFQSINTRISSTALSAVDPKKEIGVLPPIGFFEYVYHYPLFYLLDYYLTLTYASLFFAVH